MTHPFARFAALLLPCSAVFFLPGCESNANTGSAAATSDETAGNAAPAAAPAFDLEGNMKATVAALRIEADTLRKALASWDALTDADRQAYWAALQEGVRLADERQAMLAAHPDWGNSMCGWYDAVLRQPYGEVVQLGLRLSKQSMTGEGGKGGARNRRNQLWLDAAGSQEAVRAYLDKSMNAPLELTNLHIFCVKYGFIEDD